MKVLEVIPITRGIFASGTLSYFSIKPVSRGDLVKISLRNKETSAIVGKVADVSDEKVALKKSGFKLKPIKAVICEKFFSDDWFKILEKLSRTLLIPSHAILSSILPKAILANPKSDFGKLTEVGLRKHLREHCKYALKGSFEDRVDYFRGIIREHFARKKSLMVITPRIDNIEKLKNLLGRGIDDYIFCFSSELAAKKYLLEYDKALREAHPILIIGTPQVLFLDRPDLETLVIDEESSRLWRDRGFFSLDFRRVAEIVSEEKKLKLFFSDQVLRIETIYKAEMGLIEAKNTISGRIQDSVETKIIEMLKTENFFWISDDLSREIKDSLRRGEKILLFANRKGYSSFTICQDCSRPQLCSNCSVPLVLHKIRDARKFICHHCFKVQEVPTSCQSCGSWRLKDYGLGIEKVAEEFSKLFPKAEFECQRSDLEVPRGRTAHNSEKVVIGTEAIFSHPETSFDLVAVISIDNLFTIPDFRINETIFRLIIELKQRAKKKFILQTRLNDNKLIKDAVSGNISGFYQDEIEARKNFGYPPFAAVIKLSYGSKDLGSLKKEGEKALSVLKDYNPISFPAFHEKINGLYRRNILLKMPNGWRRDDKLQPLLENLSGIWQVSVDPESII